MFSLNNIYENRKRIGLGHTRECEEGFDGV